MTARQLLDVQTFDAIEYFLGDASFCTARKGEEEITMSGFSVTTQAEFFEFCGLEDGDFKGLEKIDTATGGE